MKRKKFDFHFTDGIKSFPSKNMLKLYINWLDKICKYYNKEVFEIEFIFCDDNFLHKINKDKLGHDTYTDIISFQFENSPIEGEIYISLERVNENACLYKVSVSNELLRVMSHGLLHFFGYNDKTKVEAEEMRIQEEVCIGLASSELEDNRFIDY